MPSAITSSAMQVKPGVLARVRTANRRSRQVSSIQATRLLSHTRSRMFNELPSLICACRRASCGFIPRAWLSSISCCRWDSSSLCRSASSCDRRKNRFRFTIHLLLGGFSQYPADRGHHVAPPLPFGAELFFPGRRQLVELCLAIVLTRAPIGRHPSAMLQPVQRRIERSLLHFQHVVGSVLNDVRDGMPVCRSGDQSSKDEHVQRSLHHLCALGSFPWHPHAPIEYLWEERYS